jgi:hypothetical protein
MWIKMKVKDSMPLINKVIKDKNVFAVPGHYNDYIIYQLLVITL